MNTRELELQSDASQRQWGVFAARCYEIVTRAVSEAARLARPGDLGGWYLLLFIHRECYGIQMPMLTVS